MPELRLGLNDKLMFEAHGRPVARVGDKTTCGAVIVQGSSMADDNGRAVAYIGAPTSHGGMIVEGSPTATTLP